MRSLYISGGVIQLCDLAPPARPPGEALVRVRLAGICHTDLELARGYMDFRGVPGHEFVGEVAEADDRALTGARVVGEINAGCGTCGWCRGGLERHCPTRTVLGILGRPGAHAEWLCLPERNLQRVPDTVPDDAAVFAEPLAAACEILEQVHIEPGQRVAVVGDGKLGLLVAQVLVLTGCELLVLGRHPGKLGILARRGLATHLLEGESLDVSLARWADVVVEASGRPRGLATALRLLRPRGTLVLKSTYVGSPEVYLAGLVIDEITVVGSRCGPLAPALRLLERRQVEVAALVAGRYPLAAGPAAYSRAATPGTLKVLLEVGGTGEESLAGARQAGQSRSMALPRRRDRR